MGKPAEENKEKVMLVVDGGTTARDGGAASSKLGVHGHGGRVLRGQSKRRRREGEQVEE